MIVLPEINAEIFAMTPWQLQIALLPVHRQHPDDDRNEQAADKRAAGRQVAIDKAKALKQQNTDAIIQLLWQYPRSQSSIGRETGLCRETVRKLLHDLEAQGRVTSETTRNLTRWKLTCR